MKTKYSPIHRCIVNGLSHHQYCFCAKQINVGDELYLERQPTNQFDNNAIKVMFDHEAMGREQIGWIPAADNKILAKLLDAGCDLRAHVISHDPANPKLDSRLYISIHIGIAE